jgi:hypothetical protein
MWYGILTPKKRKTANRHQIVLTDVPEWIIVDGVVKSSLIIIVNDGLNLDHRSGCHPLLPPMY